MTEPKYFKLSADQVGLIKHVKGAPRNVLNLPCRIDLESEIDENMAVEAMCLSMKRLPYCRLRLHEIGDDEFLQYYYDGEPENMDIVDMTDSSEKEVDEYILKQAGALFENNCNDSQLYNFKLIKRAGGRYTIFYCGYHIIMDTFGLMYAITYFDKVYSALKNKTELPPKGMGPEKYIEKSWEYINSPRFKKDLDWWGEQFETEPHFASMNPKPSAEYVDGKNYGRAQTFAQMASESLPLKIPKALVQKVNDAALKMNISPMIYYALALRTWMANNSGSDDVTLGTTGARRSTNIYRNCGMTTAHLITWRSIIDAEMPFNDALIKLNVIQRDVFRHIGSDLSDYAAPVFKKYNCPPNGIYRSIVFTYQPYFNVENVDLKFTARHVNVGFTPYPLYLNLMPHDASGDLWADYIYAVGYLKPENLEKFHSFMLKFIENGIDNPSRTINDLKAELLS